MNLMNALDAQGFGAIWLSSGALRDPEVKFALGFAATDALLGWIHVGTPAPERPRPARPGPESFWRAWTPGEAAR
jgi:nitroreductase